MPNTFTKNTFSSTYKDDFKDSDNYHRILFNSGKALQARELTQMQTITQTEISRLGRHIFNQGAAVNPGSVYVNNQYEFIKLAESSLPSGTFKGVTLTGSVDGVKAEVLEAVDAADGDPPTLFVRYTNSGTAVADGTTPVRFAPNEVLTGGPSTVNVAAQPNPNSPAVGQGTRVSIASGDFFAIDRFVFAKEQSMILSKYDNKPDATIGFKVVEDIVTVDDTDALYDNQGATPNRSSPGADRYRIQLTIVNEADVASDENFVYVAKIKDGKVATQVTGVEEYNKINDILATRTQEESGNYIAQKFELDFVSNADNANKLDYRISRGIAYVDGYRSLVDAPTSITIDKPRTTLTSNNNVVSVNYGNFLNVSGNKGLPNVDVLDQVTFKSNTGWTGTTLGTARVRSVVEDGSNYKVYFFDIRMNAGKNKQNIKSFGKSTSDYFNVTLENSKAVFKETANDRLIFKLPVERPKSVSDISLTVQRKQTVSLTAGVGSLSNLTATGETFADQDLWIAADSAAYAPTIVSGGNASTSAEIGGGPGNNDVEVLYYVNKSAGSVRNKVLTETTETVTPDGDGNVQLQNVDIHSIIRMTNTDSDGTSVQSSYTLDNGQRDNFYDRGRMLKKSGQTTPAGDVFVRYKYFSHGASGDFFAVNSYTGQVDYGDIPTYTATDGTKLDLRDCLDFRSSVNTSGNFGSGARINELPRDADTTQFDAEYYLGKKAKLVIDRFSTVSVLESDPALDPQFPETPANSMELYRITMNPFTINDSDVVKQRIPAKRYTMADIGKIESRLDKLEEMTSLSLLELDTSAFEVLDSANNSRLKSGFFVDNFADQQKAFTEDLAYQASIDIESKTLRPMSVQNNINLKYDSDESTDTVLRGDNVYLKYEHKTYIDQPEATESENINPFAVIINEGLLEMSPTTDSWVERKYVADKDNPLQTRVIPSTEQRPFLFNDFIFNWTGRSINLRVGDVVGERSFVQTVTDDEGRQRDFDVTQTDTVIGDVSERRFVADHIIDQVFIPYMRSRKVYFRSFGMKPNTRHFAYFDNQPVADWVRSETFQRIASSDSDYGTEHIRATQHPAGKSNLTSNAEGYISGSFFIPSTKTTKFRTGTREFKLLDIQGTNTDDATSFATTTFTSTGILETRQREYNNLRTVTIGGSEDRRRRRRGDPLAQTFMVEDNEGVFITKVGVKFKSKDDTVPVAVQIRPTVNGIPSADDIIPGATKVLSPSAVSTSSDASTKTYFEFDEPIYLNGNTEYSIILMADTTGYEVYVARAGDLKLGSTERRVTKQPSLGSMFLSQNARTWTPDQERDLTFELQRAKFTVSEGYFVAENRQTPKFNLENDDLLTDSASNKVTMFALGHGFQVGDKVTISGATAAGGLTAGNINGERTITDVDGYGFKFTAGATATSTALGGGADMVITPNLQFTEAYPIISQLVPPNTLVTHSAKFTTGKSLAGSETSYTKDTAYQPITNQAIKKFDSPRLVATRKNETDNLSSAKSLTYRVKMTSSSDLVSPIIDTQRTSVTLVGNLIDKQAAVAATGFNVPLNYVAETNSNSGSMLGKHLTIPVQLAQDAIGLKILLAAHRPSVSDFDVYYRTNTDDANGNIFDADWTLAEKESTIPADENPRIYRDYRYLIGGQGGDLDAFNTFQLKIVFKSTNAAKVPVIKDLRAIALAT